MLAYVFWHVPAPGVADYEARLAAFHHELREAAPAWLGPTATFGLDSVPWLDGPAGYEDWYLVEDFGALGSLNEAAVSGPRKPLHDAAAAAARSGAGGVMGHVAGAQLPAATGWGAWLAKPAGAGYPAFHAELAAALPPGAGAWRRQMVLGPSTEYCVLAPGAMQLPWPTAHAWPLRPVVAPNR